MPRRYEPYYLPDKFIYNFAAQNLGGFDDQGDIIFTRNLDSETINSLDYETFLKFLILLETFEMSGLAIKLIKLSEHKHLMKRYPKNLLIYSPNTHQKKLQVKNLIIKLILQDYDQTKLIFPKNNV